MKLQATGFAPGEWWVKHEFCHEDWVEKRGVRVCIYRLDDGYCIGLVRYMTKWARERDFTWVSDQALPMSLGDVSGWVRTLAGDVLPPGAGYPATESFKARQEALRGTMGTLTLVCLTQVLKQIEELP